MNEKDFNLNIKNKLINIEDDIIVKYNLISSILSIQNNEIQNIKLASQDRLYAIIEKILELERQINNIAKDVECLKKQEMQNSEAQIKQNSRKKSCCAIF